PVDKAAGANIRTAKMAEIVLAAYNAAIKLKVVQRGGCLGKGAGFVNDAAGCNAHVAILLKRDVGCAVRGVVHYFYPPHGGIPHTLGIARNGRKPHLALTLKNSRSISPARSSQVKSLKRLAQEIAAG